MRTLKIPNFKKNLKCWHNLTCAGVDGQHSAAGDAGEGAIIVRQYKQEGETDRSSQQGRWKETEHSEKGKEKL